jgi:hypothetical protein
VLVAVDGAASLVLDVLVITSLQRLLGNELLGRAFAGCDTLVVAALLIGTVVGAPLVAAVGLDPALLLSGAVVVAAGLVLLGRAASLDRRAAERAALVRDRVELLAPLDLFAGASRATTTPGILLRIPGGDFLELASEGVGQVGPVGARPGWLTRPAVERADQQ